MNGWSFAVTVVAVAGIAVTCAIGMVIVAMDGRDIPPALAALGSAAVGALAGHLGAMGYRLTLEGRSNRGL